MLTIVTALIMICAATAALADATDDKAAADKVAALIDAIYVQEWTEDTDARIQAAKEAWDALEARELIKCSVQREAPLSAREACQELCERVHAAPVQCIGGKFSIYRPRRKDPTIQLP